MVYSSAQLVKNCGTNMQIRHEIKEIWGKSSYPQNQDIHISINSV
jgi:hypothetical protein